MNLHTPYDKEPKEISLIQAADIAHHKKPAGLYYAKAENTDDFVAISSNGYRVETESFTTKEECLKWLKQTNTRE